MVHNALSNEIVIVAGLGEVGWLLPQILKRVYDCAGVDVSPVEITRPCSVLHVCYPFQLPDFVGTTAAYIGKYRANYHHHQQHARGRDNPKSSGAGKLTLWYTAYYGETYKNGAKYAPLLEKCVAGFDEKFHAASS